METHITISTKLEELSIMRQKIIDFILVNNTISSKLAELIVLSIDEVCTNLIKYAYRDNNKIDNIIDIHITLLKHKLITIIKDYSNSFDIREHVNKNCLDNVKKLIPGGLGIHIVTSFMDEIFYEKKTEQNKFNTLTLIKHL